MRHIISPKKTKSDEWLGIMRAAHRLGMSTTATMMWGHVETLDERVEHLRRIRELQDEMHGFRAFISWTFQPDNTELAAQVSWFPTSFDYLLMQAVSRIYLDNVDHIQSSWVTQGMKIGQVALFYGADDLGSIMIEENVVSAAGTTHRAGVDDFLHTIRNAGFRPAQRDTLYRIGQGLPQGVKVVGLAPHGRRRPSGVWPWLAEPACTCGRCRSSVVADRGAEQRRHRLRGQRDGHGASAMVVRVVETDPPRRLVEERVDGTRRGTTEFEIAAADGAGSRRHADQRHRPARLLARFAKGPSSEGCLKAQLEMLDRLSSAAD